MNEGRKRSKTADPAKWKRNINEKLRMEGKSYLGFTKNKNEKIKRKVARKIKSRCSRINCQTLKFRHCDRFNDSQQMKVFEDF